MMPPEIAQLIAKKKAENNQNAVGQQKNGQQKPIQQQKTVQQQQQKPPQQQQQQYVNNEHNLQADPALINKKLTNILKKTSESLLEGVSVVGGDELSSPTVSQLESKIEQLQETVNYLSNSHTELIEALEKMVTTLAKWQNGISENTTKVDRIYKALLR